MSSESNENRFATEVVYDARLPTADPGVTLGADIVRPVDAGPVPVLVSAYPYRKDWVGDLFSPLMHWFAERGYASLLVDLRGTGTSDGEYCEFDPVEGYDVVAAIEWAAAQPWCDGNVGMWGHSYGALTTMRAASLNPPSLKAILPVQGPVDPSRYTVHPDGARGDLHGLVVRGMFMLDLHLRPPMRDYTSVPQLRRWQRRLQDFEPVFVDFARHPPGDPVWRERGVDAAAITVPALCVGGWQDPHCESIASVFEQVSGPKKLLIGPWGHTLPHSSAVEPIDFPLMALRWWDHWLRGINTGVMDEPPVTLYIPGDEPAWRCFEHWPPSKSDLVLSTGTSTDLSERSHVTKKTSEVIAVYRPDPTTGVLSGMWGTAFSGTGPHLDQHDDDLRSLTFTSSSLPADVRIVGRPEVSVRLAQNDRGDPTSVERLVVRLAEVDSQGRSTFITAGVLCPDEPKERHRVTLRPTAVTVRAGQRLRVVLSDTDFPRLTPLPYPSPIPVTAIELVVPTLSDDVGGAIDLPAVVGAPTAPTAARPDHSLATQVRAITRNPVNDAIEVVIGSGPDAPYISIGQGHRMKRNLEIRATVRHAAPEAAVITGSNKTDLRMTTGEQITITTTVRCTQATLWARGEVTIDGLTTFDRTWEAALRHKYQHP